MSRQLNSRAIALGFTIVLMVYGCIPLSLIAQGFGTLKGQVIADRSYPSGAVVRIFELGCENEQRKISSQPGGIFELNDLPADQYCVEVTYADFDPYLIPKLTILPASNLELVIRLKKNSSLIAPAVYGDIRLVEQNGTLGDRLENGSVELQSRTGKPQGRVEQGRFQIAKLQAGRYDVYVIPRAATRRYLAGSLELNETTARIQVDIRLPRETYAQLIRREEETEEKKLVAKAGYIDSAIVASQVRIRFEAGFHSNAPDRAEFFYAQCKCNGGPGPDAVVADLQFQQFYLRAEYALTKRLSLFMEVPVRWIQPQMFVGGDRIPNEAGFSDIREGFKLAAVTSSRQYLTFQFQAYFPSGSASKGLGTNHYTVEPALLYYQRLSDRAALEAQVGDSHPIGGSKISSSTTITPNMSNPGGFAGDVFFYGVGPSYILYRGESVRIAPVVELVGWRVLGGFETTGPGTAASADGANIVNLKMGARIMFGTHSSFYLGYGRALTSATWYSDIVRVEYRYSF